MLNLHFDATYAFTDYALRILVYAAARPDQRCLTADVASAYGVSRHHVVKVVNELQHLGYIEPADGAAGSRWLGSPEHIRVGDVVRRTESARSSSVSTVTRIRAHSPRPVA